LIQLNQTYLVRLNNSSYFFILKSPTDKVGLFLYITTMRINTEPVDYTCPEIDKIVSTITEITNSMKTIDVKSDIYQLIEQWTEELEIIGVGNWCLMEELRTSNSTLRKWGVDMSKKIDTLEDEITTLTQKIKDQ